MDNWKNNTIWFEQIPKSLQAYVDLKESNGRDLELGNIEYLTLVHHNNKTRHLMDLHLPETLQYLDLTSSTIQNFIGIEKLTGLKRLELHYCTKLHSDEGLSCLADTLEHLHINQSKKFVPSEELLSLKNLRVLRLNTCGELENLQFLNQFPKLIDFRFVNTNVRDGDLTPIVNHHSIRSAGFINKRHYNIKDDEMKEMLMKKNDGKAFKTIMTYGKYETFRYHDHS
ncbi:hypothetical protein ACFQPF_15585 [Fictibacillus iocasae]|uniref:Internalin n=1 Tax=Fictibacillus iocasae TaxID=2715437 RepID=A0ABW2NT81_9BACL